MRMLKILLLMLLVLAMAAPVWAGPNSRTIEIEAYETIKESIEVPFVLVDPNDPVNEKLCDINLTGEYGCTAFETVNECETFKTTDGIKQNGKDGATFSAPEGTLSLTGEWRDWIKGKKGEAGYWGDWVSAELYKLGGRSDNWKFESGKHDEYRNFEATVQTCSEETYCVEWTDDRVATVDCPADSVTTKSVFVNYSYDRIVTEVYSGDTITVRGHIWTRNPKPVEYWYLAQKANNPSNPAFIAKSERVLVPDVNGVYATESWSFTAPDVTKDTVVRIFLKIKKVDGTLGSIRTKVIVHPRPQYDLN